MSQSAHKGAQQNPFPTMKLLLPIIMPMVSLTPHRLCASTHFRYGQSPAPILSSHSLSHSPRSLPTPASLPQVIQSCSRQLRRPSLPLTVSGSKPAPHAQSTKHKAEVALFGVYLGVGVLGRCWGPYNAGLSPHPRAARPSGFPPTPTITNGRAFSKGGNFPADIPPTCV